MKTFLIIIALLSSFVTMAQVDTLATVTNSMDSDKYKLTIVTDDSGSLASLHVVENGTKDSVYNLEQVQKGITLLVRDNRKIITLIGAELDATAGGEVMLSYLYNGITGKRKQVRLEIFTQDGKWVMQSEEKIIITKIHFTTKKILGKVVGLDKMIVE